MSLEDIYKATQAQAQRRAATEAAARERQQAEGEKRERIFRVWQLLNAQREFHCVQNFRDGDFCQFDYNGHRYEIREVEGNKR